MADILSTVALIANGKMGRPRQLAAKIRAYPYLIAVDGGLNMCHKLGLKPDFIVGDLDSVKEEVLGAFAQVPQKVFPVDKDYTDLELAIEHALSLGAKRLTAFGALGGRVDHTLYNLELLTRHSGKLFYETEEELVFAVDKRVEFPTRKNQTISLLPLNSAATGVTTEGLKWELANAKLDKNFMSVCNVALRKKVKVEVAEGDLLCFIQLRRSSLSAPLIPVA